MPTRRSEAHWQGGARDGHGTLHTPHAPLGGDFSFDSRLRHGEGTSPEELLGAALAGCFSMALAYELSEKGYWPKHIHVTAKVHLDETAERGVAISRIDLDTEGDVPAIGLAGFEEEAERVIGICPVAVALDGVHIEVHASLMGEDPPQHGD